jgi:hypothetical protein
LSGTVPLGNLADTELVMVVVSLALRGSEIIDGWIGRFLA